MSLRDILGRTETPATIERRAAGRIVRRMMTSRCEQGNGNEIVLATGNRGKVSQK